MAAEQLKKACRRKERKFNQLCEKYDPDMCNSLWPSVVNFREVWTEQINDVLEDLFDSIDEMLEEHEADFGAPEVTAWKLVISNANKKFREIAHDKSLWEKMNLGSNVDVPAELFAKLLQKDVIICHFLSFQV